MPRSLVFRSVFVATLAAAFVPVAFCQSQDSPSIAEAARKAREKKKDAAKPTKVITDETLDVKKGDVQSAVAEEPRMPGAPATTKQPQANPVAPNATAQAAKDEKLMVQSIEKVKAKAPQSIYSRSHREQRLPSNSNCVARFLMNRIAEHQCDEKTFRAPHAYPYKLRVEEKRGHGKTGC